MNTRAVARALILTLIFGPVATAGGAAPASADGHGFAQCAATGSHATPATVIGTRPDAVLTQQSGGELVEILSGAQARDHLYELARRRPARFKTFGAELQRRSGYQPTEQVVVARTVTFGTAKNLYPDLSLPPAVLANKAKNSKGQVIFWSWNDGKAGTWEGSLYAEDFKTGRWITADGQADISTANYTSIWAKKTGSGQEEENDLPVGRSLSPSPHLRPVEAGWPNPFAEEYLGYWLCLAAGCVGCAASCTLTGPGWPGCAIPCCVGVIIACSIQEFLG